MCTVFWHHEGMAIIGYARVSTRDQNPDYEEHALRESGAEKVFVEKASSRKRDRAQWLACLGYLRPGDELLVHRLDRLSGSWHLFQLMAELGERGVSVRSLTEPVAIDPSTPMGRAMYGMIAVFAQLRIDTIQENTRAGLAYAKLQGRIGGRPTVMTPERRAAAQAMRATGASFAAIGQALGVSRATATKLAAPDSL